MAILQPPGTRNEIRRCQNLSLNQILIVITSITLIFYNSVASTFTSFSTSQSLITFCSEGEEKMPSITKITSMKKGPDFFCEANLEIFRATMKDRICGIGNASLSPSGGQHRKPKITFLHFPKTGGESFEKILKLSKNHNEAQERSKDYVTKNGEEFVAVTIIRNPYDRLLSWFRFCLHGWRGTLPMPQRHCLMAHQIIQKNEQHTLASLSISFEEWLQKILLQKKYFTSFITFPQTYFLGGPNDLMIDYYIRFEHYENDLNFFLAKLGIIRTAIDHENGSSSVAKGIIKPSYEWRGWNVTTNLHVLKILGEHKRHDMYTRRSQKLVELWFASDLDLFNYTFE